MARAVFKQLEPLPDDTNEMKIAIDVLNRVCAKCERKTKWQLKIENLSYYPNKRTIYRDGDDRALRERGLESLMRLVAESQQRTQHIQEVAKPEVIDLSNLSTEEVGLPPGVLNMKQLSQKYGWGRS